MDDDTSRQLTYALDVIERLWFTGTVAPSDLAAAATEQPRLADLLTAIRQVQEFAVLIANGDLSRSPKLRGYTAGSLKALQANLRHLTWQTKMIAEGDLTQRVDYMGEFAESFNAMVQNLADARAQLERANALLTAEVCERARAQEQLRQINERLQTQLHENETLRAQLHEQAIRDPLTNLFNRRYLQATLERELAGAVREQCSVGLLMLDIDHFKRLNDTFGHKAGDAVLVALADLLQTSTRQSDVVCRYGGEEFVIVMPGTSIELAVQRGEQMRRRFDALSMPFAETALCATFSLGIAIFPRNGKNGDELLRAADAALYEAKAKGRNCVCLAPAPPVG